MAIEKKVLGGLVNLATGPWTQQTRLDIKPNSQGTGTSRGLPCSRRPYGGPSKGCPFQSLWSHPTPNASKPQSDTYPHGVVHRRKNQDKPEMSVQNIRAQGACLLGELLHAVNVPKLLHGQADVWLLAVTPQNMTHWCPPPPHLKSQPSESKPWLKHQQLKEKT